MPEETKTAVPSGEQTAVSTEKPPVEEKVLDVDKVTEDNVLEFKRNGSRDEIRAIIQAAKDHETKPESAVSRETKPPAEKVTDDKKPRVWNTRYKGREENLPDEDGFLGFKDFGGLKKNAAFYKLKVADYEKEIQDLRNKIVSVNTGSEEAQTLKTELERIKGELTETKKKAETAAAAPQQSAQQSTPIDMNPPTPPEEDLSPLDDDNVKVWGKYNKEVAAYLKKIPEFIKQGGTITKAQMAELPPDLQQTITDLKAKSEKYDSLVEEVEKGKKQGERDKAIDAFWERLGSFQMLHKDYTTTKPLREIEKDYLKFSDDLAEANGIVKPLTPYNRKTPEWQKFEADSAALMDKLFEDDEAVKASADGLLPPDKKEQMQKEIEIFLRTINLNKKRDAYIEKGRLGKDSTLDDAWQLELKDNGGLETLITNVEKENLAKGVSSTVKAMQSVKKEFATTIPPEVGGEEIIPGVKTVEDAQKILNMTPTELAADPEKRKLHKELIKAINET